MKLDSKYFDSIRVSRSRTRGRADPQASTPCCQWANCTKRGLHRAPKERAAEGEYYHFCREHVAAYNKSYNYFAGMNDGEITNFQKSAATGHRPTWPAGVHGTDPGTTDALRSGAAGENVHDPFELLKAVRGRAASTEQQPQKPPRIIHKGARKHLLALNLDGNATAEEIRNQFKALVKLHHPDHNGGDRGSEERFREVISAYNYLKQAGLC